MPIQQMLLGVVAATKTYVDDLFSTYLYKGNATARSINNGIDLAGEGGLVWTKSRSHARNHSLHDSARGVTCLLKSNSNTSQYCDATQMSSFNSNGFSLGTDGSSNTNGDEYTSWTFRKAPGFFDVVTYTGTGTTAQNISHNLGSVPGMIFVKETSGTGNWFTYHKSKGKDYAATLDGTQAFYSTASWDNTEPTSTHFRVKHSDTNDNGSSYVAYVFAGGESTAATARSVYFDGSGGDRLHSANSSNYNFGSGNFTIDGWFKLQQTGMRGLAANWSSNSNNRRSWRLFTEDAANGELEFWTSTNGSSVTKTLSGGRLSEGQWTHFAVVRSSNTLSLYLNGELVDSASFTGTFYNNTVDPLQIGGGDNPDSNDYTWKGDISNFRIVKGTAVYTSSFKPPTEPLTSISGTSILCCNNSSITGSTTTSGTITQAGTGSPTASTNSPFDDPAAFTFGESGSESVIKTGSYVGSGSAGLEVNVGFEPQFIIFKNASASWNWYVLDVMRGIVSNGDEAILSANTNSAEFDSSYIDVTPTGFKVQTSHALGNGDGNTYIYIAIRRQDGYVGKPPELGTGVFAMDTGSESDTIPNYDSNFPVDLGIYRSFGGTYDWYTASRLTGDKYLFTNTTAAEATYDKLVFDSNVGWSKDEHDSAVQSWMWKRHAGFDVVAYEGISGVRQISHSLGKPAEMIWIKRRDGSEEWAVGHKGMDSGGWNKYMKLNSSVAEANAYGTFNSTAPTATHFSLSTSSRANYNGYKYIAMLFASVDGISSVGSYSGSSSDVTINLGFQPRFMIVKAYNSASGNQRWQVMDTLRGMAAGATATNRIYLDDSQAQQAGPYVTSVSSTGYNFKNRIQLLKHK